MNRPLTPRRKNRIVDLLKRGKSYAQVAADTGVSKAAVGKIAAPLDGPWKRQPGRPRLITDREERRLAYAIGDKGIFSGPLTQIELASISQKRVSLSTARRVAKRAGFVFKKPRRVPGMEKRHLRRRLDWAKEHVNWTEDDWARVLWSDEVRIKRCGPDGPRWRLVRPEEALTERTVNATKQGGGGSVMVWGAMAASGVGQLVTCSNRVNEAEYRQILDIGINPSFRKLGIAPEPSKQRWFMQDGASSHAAARRHGYFRGRHYKVFDWPAYSPDLNPIEHLWPHLKRALYETTATFDRLDDIWPVLCDAWFDISTELCRKLALSMPGRCAAVIAARGGPTTY